MPLTITEQVNVIKFIAGPDMPSWMSGYVGSQVRVSSDDIALLNAYGHIDYIIFEGGTVWGYLRLAPQGWYEWVISAGPDSLTNAINEVPGPQWWTDETQRDAVKSVAEGILSRGGDWDAMILDLKAVYAAAVANYVAEQASSEE